MKSISYCILCMKFLKTWQVAAGGGGSLRRRFCDFGRYIERGEFLRNYEFCFFGNDIERQWYCGIAAGSGMTEDREGTLVSPSKESKGKRVNTGKRTAGWAVRT